LNGNSEIIFLIEDAPDGGYSARALGEAIFTEADNMDELHKNVREAVECHFDEDELPKMIRLQKDNAEFGQITIEETKEKLFG